MAWLPHNACCRCLMPGTMCWDSICTVTEVCCCSEYYLWLWGELHDVSIYCLCIVMAMHMCATVTHRACDVGGKWTHLINLKGTWHTLCMQTLHVLRSTSHISYNSVCQSRLKTWCQKEKLCEVFGISLATRRMILTKAFCATMRGNTTNLFDHLRW